MVNGFKITKKEYILAITIALMGFIFSSKQWLMFLFGKTPLVGLGIYYALIFGIFFTMSKFGLVIFNINMRKPLQLLGLTLITFSIFTTINFESRYVDIVTSGNENAIVNSIYLQAEDGATFYLWNEIMGFGIEASRWLTFIITPFILTITGSLLASEKVKL
jgi:hypothetical protein